jgi:hypothetical protein
VSEWFNLRGSNGLYLLDGDECGPGSEIKSGEVAVMFERPTIPRRKGFLAANKATFRYHKLPAPPKGQQKRNQRP